MTGPVQRPHPEHTIGDHQKRIRKLEAASHPARFNIKVTSDTDALATGDGQFIFAIPDDVSTANLLDAQAYISTAGSGPTVVQIRNVTTAQDMLSTPITIDAAETTSYFALSKRVIDLAYHEVATGHLISVDVDTAGGGAKGLGVLLVFG